MKKDHHRKERDATPLFHAISAYQRTRYFYSVNGSYNILISPSKMIEASMIASPILGILYYLLHAIVSLAHIWSYLIYQIQCLIISSGLLPKYQNLKLDRLQHLAVVIDSEEAKNKSKVHQLLLWLSDTGVKYVILYDIEGVMKKSNKAFQKSTATQSDTKCLGFDLNVPSIFDVFGMTVEVISYTDGKEAVAKAANYLFSKFSTNQEGTLDGSEPKFTEPDISSALKAVGHDGPEPDLLLVYGPARCHLGFPAWRMRYTEIVHMGRLSSMKFSAIVKVFYDFSKKHQNYVLYNISDSIKQMQIKSLLKELSW